MIVLQQGRGTFVTPGETWPVTRANVFAERATALYLPPGVPLEVKADSELEAIVVSAPSSAAGTPALLRPDEVTVNARGRGTYAREVHDLFVRDPHARRLMVGETFNPPGHWSSFPPHKHDGRNGEPFLEEVYYFRVSPAHGFGHQMLYTTDGESVTHQFATAMRCCCRTGIILSRHPRAMPSTISGRWRATSGSWRSTKTRRIPGFTIRKQNE